MGAEGLEMATKAAILNANYLAACLNDTYGIVYRGTNGFVGHEMILDCRRLHEESGIDENDISKRLMDFQASDGLRLSCSYPFIPCTWYTDD